MARLWGSGAELNSITSEVEFGVSGSPEIVSTTKRSGTYSLRIREEFGGAGLGFIIQQFSSAATDGPIYVRFCLYITTLPSADNTIFALQIGGSLGANIKLSSTGALKLFKATT